MKFFVASVALVVATSGAGCVGVGDLSAEAPAYDVATVRIAAGSWGAIRFHTGTGSSAYYAEGQWIPITDSVAVPPATYTVQMIALQDDWGALRLDVGSGRAWAAVDGSWAEIEE